MTHLPLLLSLLNYIGYFCKKWVILVIKQICLLISDHNFGWLCKLKFIFFSMSSFFHYWRLSTGSLTIDQWSISTYSSSIHHFQTSPCNLFTSLTEQDIKSHEVVNGPCIKIEQAKYHKILFFYFINVIQNISNIVCSTINVQADLCYRLYFLCHKCCDIMVKYNYQNFQRT